MIVVTGAFGFIGSYFVGYLNQKGIENIIAVDDFNKVVKEKNLEGKKITEKINRSDFFEWATPDKPIEAVFHLGARTDTTEFDKTIFDELNENYSQKMWKMCAVRGIPLVYASSAATYGGGELGYTDSHDLINQLSPLNPYGVSKNNFDIWALNQTQKPPFFAGLKFFNVYGPNEYHKGRMASVIFHAFNQIKTTGKMKLFRSHNPDFKDGEQIRDFIYVGDIANICWYMYTNKPASGLYNAGTGKARTFLDLVKNTFKEMNIEEKIEFIDTPLDIRDKYQYFTEADTNKLINSGFNLPFLTLEEGVELYVGSYLSNHKYF